MRTHHTIQQSIDYIEVPLEESLSLEEIASHVSFSSYHFHRMFRKEVGRNIADYVGEEGGITMGESNTSSVKGWFMSGSHPMDYEMGLSERSCIRKHIRLSAEH